MNHAGIIIVGAGAAGVFAALRAKYLAPDKRVLLLEKTTKALAKVKVSGGGRCNVTHDTVDIPYLLSHYPRGQQLLKRAFRKFAPADTVKWFESRGVKLKTESDGRMFPVTDNSQTIIDCLMKEASALQVEIEFKKSVTQITKSDLGFELFMADGTAYSAKALIIAAGGLPSIKDYNFFSNLPLEIVTPVPSLFTFNVKGHRYHGLEGIAVPNASVRIQGTKWVGEGPLLITHWGFSGPAILKLSSWGARDLAAIQYRGSFQVNWLAGNSENDLREKIQQCRNVNGLRQVFGQSPFDFPKRLWERQLSLAGMPEVKWAEAPAKPVNKLVEEIRNGSFLMDGKTTFKEEFVTAGGVALSEIDPESLACKKVPGLYFAGEVLDIDALTGGFNFQAAWTTGWIAGGEAVTFLNGKK